MNWSTKTAVETVAVGVLASGVFTVAACDSGVPPRHQADTLAHGQTSPTTSLATTSSHSSRQSASEHASPNDDTPPAPNAALEPKPEYTPPPVLPGDAKPEPSPAPVFDPERACRRDADCALVPDDCTHCPPCEATWRRAANRVAVNRIIKARQAMECPPIACVQCSLPTPPGQPPQQRGYLGNSAACQAGQCVVK